MIHPSHTAAFQLSLRAALAAAFAIALAELLRLQFPIYAMISAVVVTDLQPSKTRELALPRLAGTVLGAILGAAICAVLRPNAWEVGAGILAAMFLSHLLGLRDAARVAGYVCGIVLFDFGEHPWSYAFHRTIETALGIGMAILVSLVPKLLRATEPKPEEL